MPRSSVSGFTNVSFDLSRKRCSFLIYTTLFYDAVLINATKSHDYFYIFRSEKSHYDSLKLLWGSGFFSGGFHDSVLSSNHTSQIVWNCQLVQYLQILMKLGWIKWQIHTEQTYCLPEDVMETLLDSVISL